MLSIQIAHFPKHSLPAYYTSSRSLPLVIIPLASLHLYTTDPTLNLTAHEDWRDDDLATYHQSSPTVRFDGQPLTVQNLLSSNASSVGGSSPYRGAALFPTLPSTLHSINYYATAAPRLSATRPRSSGGASVPTVPYSTLP